MNKSDLVSALATHTNTSKVEAAAAVEALFNPTTGILATAIQGGDKVSIQGFGSFSAKATAARTAKNPKTGETIQVAAATKAKFSPGANLKATLNS